MDVTDGCTFGEAVGEACDLGVTGDGSGVVGADDVGIAAGNAVGNILPKVKTKYRSI